MSDLAHHHPVTHEHGPGCGGARGGANIVSDPVCGMTVDLDKTAHRALVDGTDYGFCCAGCRTRFLADPARYLEAGTEAQAAAVPGALYTCPMHPEVQHEGPGACPICGMALEPATVEADAGPNHELVDLTRRLWVGSALAVPVVVLAMMDDMAGGVPGMRGGLSRGLQLALSSGVVLWAGWPFFQRGWQSVVSRHLNMFTLIAIGTGVSFGFSVLATLAPGLFPNGLRQHGGTVGVYFEAASVITVLVLVGQILELKARDTTSGAIRGLLGLAPKTVRRLSAAGTEEEVPLDTLKVGDRFRVRPGEKVAADGTVVEGRSALDQSAVTGESVPVVKGPGESVIGGTINGSGSLVVEARKVGRETLLARIVQLVAQAQRSRAPIQRLADRVAGLFVPAVLVVAVVAFGAWMAVGPEPRFAYALMAAVAVLIIACPCAVGLATPMSVMVGVGRGAEAGVLIRDAAALERLEAVDTMVIDKTGTLTKGRPEVVAVKTAPDLDEADMLRLSAGVEAASEHPLGRAIVEAARRRTVTVPPVGEFEAFPGKGALGVVEERSVLVGSAGFMTDRGLDPAGFEAVAEDLRREGASVVYVALEGRVVGVVGIADPVMDQAESVVAQLRQLGLRTVMLTGDHRQTADAVGRRLGLTEIEAEVLPAQKADVVQRLKSDGRVVAMVGDGVNDAPALALADVGIAMGTGTDIAIESAGIVLLGGDLGGVLRARRLSAATMSNIRQNLAFAFAYNAVGIPIAAGVLYPQLGLLLSPMLAAAAMALSSVSVIANALRLRRVGLG